MSYATQINAADTRVQEIRNITNPPQVVDTEMWTIVDRLAYVKGQIAELREQERMLKEALIESGQSVIESTFWRATVSDLITRPVTDWQAVAMHFKPSRQLITAHTKEGEAYQQVRVVARKTSK